MSLSVLLVRSAALVATAATAYLLATGRLGAVVVLALGAGTLFTVLRRLPEEGRGPVAAFVAGKFALQLVLAIILNAFAVAEGHPDYVIGDDGTYLNAAWTLIEYLRGDVSFATLRSLSELLGTWVYLFAVFLFIFGRDALIGAALNVVISSALVLVVFDLVRRLTGTRAANLAAFAICVHPSLALWAAVGLKDPLILLLSTVVFWSIVRFQSTKRWTYLALAFLLVVPLDSLRRFLFIGIIPLIVLAVAIAPGWTRATRVRWAAASGGVGAVLLAIEVVVWSASAFPTLATLESKRFSLTHGARSGFIDAVPAEVGQTFVINPLGTPQATVVTVTTPDPASPATSGPTPAAARPPTLTREPVVVVVQPGTRIVIAQGPVPSPSPGVAYVRAGDVVVVGPVGTTPRPASERVRLDLPPDREATTFVQGGSEAVTQRTLAYLPRGVLYVLYAPFPWEARRLVDLATIPEMLLWYCAVPAAAYALWRDRRSWRTYAPMALFLVGTAGLMALAEGNVGTLFRHRAMVIPGVLMFAAPSFVLLADRAALMLRSRLARTRATQR